MESTAEVLTTWQWGLEVPIIMLTTRGSRQRDLQTPVVTELENWLISGEEAGSSSASAVGSRLGFVQQGVGSLGSGSGVRLVIFSSAGQMDFSPTCTPQL